MHMHTCTHAHMHMHTCTCCTHAHSLMSMHMHMHCASLVGKQLVAALALLAELVPLARRDDPAGAVLLAGVHHVLVDDEGWSRQQREPVMSC